MNVSSCQCERYSSCSETRGKRESACDAPHHGRNTAYEPVRTSSERTFHVLVVLYALLVAPDQEEHVDLSKSAEEKRGERRVMNVRKRSSVHVGAARTKSLRAIRGMRAETQELTWKTRSISSETMNAALRFEKPEVQKPLGKVPVDELESAAAEESGQSCPPFAHSHSILSFL